jgi:hypothetical protein
VGAIAIAFGASVFAGIGAGLVVVTRRAARGVRPRAFIREHCEPFDAVAVFVTAFAIILSAAAVIGADALPQSFLAPRRGCSQSNRTTKRTSTRPRSRIGGPSSNATSKSGRASDAER